MSVIKNHSHRLTNTYTITGMTCGGCEAKVKIALESLPHVTSVEVSHVENKGVITTDGPVSFTVLQQALEGVGSHYKIEENDDSKGRTRSVSSPDVSTLSSSHSDLTSSTNTRTWFETYKPILLLFAYIGTASALVELASDSFSWMNWMRWFMAGFFLAFSFFKFLDLKGFAASYRMYDIVAKKFPVWGYLYAFTELLLGVVYLSGVKPFWTSVVTFTVMSVSIIGVLQTVLNKQVIQCACLGKVFDLPMSRVTIIEDGLMILMAAAMMIHYW